MTLTLTIPTIFTKTTLQELLSKMQLTDVQDQFTCYHSEDTITSYTMVEDANENAIEFNVTIKTHLDSFDKIIIDDLKITDVQLWDADAEEVEVTEEYLSMIHKAIQEQINFFI